MKLGNLLLFGLCVESSFVGLNVNKVRFDDVNGPAKVKSHHLLKRNNAGKIELEASFDQLSYNVEIEVGSNNDKVILMLDTASSDLIVNSASNSLCLNDNSGNDNDGDNGGDSEEGNNHSISSTTSSIGICRCSSESSIQKRLLPRGIDLSNIDNWTMDTPTVPSCISRGVYNSSNSATAKDTGIFFNNTYFDGTSLVGDFFTDTISFGGISIPDMMFGVNSEAYRYTGIMGIAYSSNEYTYQHGLKEYENLPLKLKSSGFIDRVVYAFGSSHEITSSNNLVFGGYDANAVEGNKLVIVPIVDSTIADKIGTGPY